MSTDVLYVHVADDGGVLVIDGKSGRSAWVTVGDLSRRLAAVRAAGGSVLLSTEKGSALAAPVLDLIGDTGVAVVRSARTHPDAVRREGATALMAAAYNGAVHLVRDLIERGADTGEQDAEGYSALMYAANAGHEQIVHVLVDAGADVNQADHAGSTPLMFAAQHGRLDIVRTLLQAGAIVNARRADGLTAWDFADGNGHKKVAALLLSAERQVP